MTALIRAAALGLALTAFAFALGLAATQPQDPQVAAILARLAGDSTVPDAYRADVKLHVHLRIFPWISLTLHGNEVYKHPGFYHFVFRGVPKAAEHFSDMAYDLGNAASWPEKYEISVLTPAAPGVDPVVRLVPRKHGMVKALDVSVDAQKGHIVRAVWSRFDGGTITLVQHYNAIGAKEVVGEQDAQIRIPGMKADLTATYENFSLGAAATGGS